MLPAGHIGYLPTAYAVIACCHIQQGRLSEAESALAVIEHPQLHCGDRLPALLATRAQLRLAQHRPQEALDDAVQAGRLWEEELGPPSPGAPPWRAIAAMAHLGLGQTGPARELATAELALARELGVTRTVIRDLCVLGLVEGGDDGIELLTEATTLGADHPTRLSHISALIALGGALRRANQRAAARDPLMAALKLCQQMGATALAMQAQTELAVTGLAAAWGHAVGPRGAHAQRAPRGGVGHGRPDHA